MMASIYAWPLVGECSGRIWSQTVVLQGKELIQPQWFVCLSVSGVDDAEAIGEGLVHQLGRAYQDSKKSAHDLLSVFKTMNKRASVNVVGMCVAGEQVTGFGYGKAGIGIMRNGMVASILTSSKQVWQQITGELLPNDLLSLCVYQDAAPKLLPLHISSDNVSIESVEGEVIGLHGTMDSGTGALLLLAHNKQIVVQETIETATPGVPWWKRWWLKNEEENAEQRAHHRKILLAGWIVLSLLIISVTVGSQARINKRYEQQLKELTQKVDQVIITADALKTVDQIKARQTVRETQEQVQSAEASFQKNDKWLKQYQAVLNKVDTYYQSIAAEVAMNEIPEWYSLGIAKPGFTGSMMVVTDGQMAVLDTNSASVLRVAIDTKRAEIVAGGELLQQAKAITSTAKKGFVLQDSGIVEISMAGKTAARIIERDIDWQRPTLLAAFNDNLYMLDDQEIWRYSGTTKQKWLGPGVSVPNQDMVAMAIDGEVWLLTNNGTILRYRRGAPVRFQITGLDVPLGATTAIGVAKDQDILAVMDKTNQRLVVLDKSGVYKKQIKWPGFGLAQTMVMDEAGQNAYILKDGIIYKAGL